MSNKLIYLLDILWNDTKFLILKLLRKLKTSSDLSRELKQRDDDAKSRITELITFISSFPVFAALWLPEEIYSLLKLRHIAWNTFEFNWGIISVE